MKLTILSILFLSFIGAYAQTQDMSFTSISRIKAIKRGVDYSVSWTGGAPNDAISIVLVSTNGREILLKTSLNSGKDAVRIPGRVRPGSYAIRVLNNTSKEVAFSENFRVKRRIPLVIQLTPLLVIPTAIAIIHGNAGVGVMVDPPPRP